jgi:molybdenum cofactor biosynthesis protein B
MAQHPEHQATNQKLDNQLPVRPDLQSDAPADSSTSEHRGQAPASVRCFIITVSDTRSARDDRGGPLIREVLEAHGHQISGALLVRDEKREIEEAVRAAVEGVLTTEAIILTGGTGIGERDVTPEAIEPLLTKHLPGFGEVFRVLSYQEIGAATVLSRAFAGVIGRTLVFALPGSPNAVRLAMEKLVAPELGHLVRELRPERRTATG